METISVILATHNRAEILNETLMAYRGLESFGMELMIVVVANACVDSTAEVIERHRSALPLIFLEEPMPGKNRALNRALREVDLGNLIVFTDDDITPAADWLRQIEAAALRHPGCNVFGGRILLRWPGHERPSWATSPKVLSASFAQHDLRIPEGPYPVEVFPFGGNYWIRKGILQKHPNFCESIGPKGNGRLMGSETSFLIPLANEGHEMIYCPEAVVEHRLKPHEVTIPTLCKRAISQGRGSAHLSGINYHNLLKTNPKVWYMREILKAVRNLLGLLASLLVIPRAKRIEKMQQAFVDLGRSFEAFKLAPNCRHDLAEVAGRTKLAKRGMR
ncbi:MAG: glycosyltransferase [Verrucomicrobiae bacterium]|nr:glycosyltransferase [Verrucomicrobiae bacterium]